MENLFAYGTLKDREIQETIFGRVLTGVPDKLVGYTIKEINIEEEFGLTPYPIITETNNPDDIISGIRYSISEHELELADNYEGKYYKRIQVQLNSNETVWTYSAAL